MGDLMVLRIIFITAPYVLITRLNFVWSNVEFISIGLFEVGNEICDVAQSIADLINAISENSSSGECDVFPLKISLWDFQ